MKKQFEAIYRRYYDNELDKDGNKKPNELLGTFEIIETIEEDSYSSIKIGRRKNTQKLYLIKEREVSYYNAGSSYQIYPINKLSIK